MSNFEESCNSWPTPRSWSHSQFRSQLVWTPLRKLSQWQLTKTAKQKAAWVLYSYSILVALLLLIVALLVILTLYNFMVRSLPGYCCSDKISDIQELESVQRTFTSIDNNRHSKQKLLADAPYKALGISFLSCPFDFLGNVACYHIFTYVEYPAWKSQQRYRKEFCHKELELVSNWIYWTHL